MFFFVFGHLSVIVF